MAAAAAITGAVVAAAGTTYAIVSSNKAQDQAEQQAKKQSDKQQQSADLLKAQGLQAQTQQQIGIAAANNKQDQQNKQGYQSTINTTPSGLTGVAVTGGQKTLLGS